MLSAQQVASAVALGDARLHSALGQSLDLDIPLTSLSASESDSLAVRLAPAEAFADAGIDYTPMLRSLHLFVEKRADGYVVKLTSDLPVNDPFVRLLVELTSNGSRMIREYTLLIDPPVLDASTAKPSPNEAAVSEPSVSGAPASGTLANPAASASTGSVSPVEPKPNTATKERRVITRVVRRGDTLRSIGTELRPEGVRLEQVMVALQNANPGSFIGRNINRVRRGSVLRVPDTDIMRAIDPVQALRTLHAQTSDFRRYQQQIAPRAASLAPSISNKTEGAGNRSSSGRVGMRSDQPDAAANASDKLTLSAPGGRDQPGSKTSTSDALDKIANDKAQADASSRIAALEKNVGQLQQLLEIRNGELAAAQQRAAPVPEPVREPAPEPVPATPAKPVPPQSAVAPNESPSSDGTSPAAPTTGPTAAPQPARVPAKQTPPPPLPAVPRDSSAAGVPSWLQAIPDDPMTRAAAALLLLLPLIWAGLRWHRRHKPERAKAIEPVVTPTVIADAGGRHVDTRENEFHSNFVPSVSQIDANEVDPVAEADVYIAYGRDEQAEEILLDALRVHRQRHALRVKLLEIYAARKDRQKFGALATELRVLTHGVGADWEQAAQLGRQLDPGNRLFDVPASSHATGLGDAPSTRDVSPLPSSVDDFGMRLEGLLDERGRGEPATPPPPLRDAASSNSLDFSLAGIDAGSSSGTRPADEAALNTKLELALACQEIGDRDGARELLGEVAGSGHAELARRARSLLSQLA